MGVAPADAPSSAPPPEWTIARPPSSRPPRRHRRSITVIVTVILQLALGAAFRPTVQGWLHIGSRYPDCSWSAVDSGKEGTCADRRGLFAPADVAVVVDRAHTLRMPGYDARLVSSAIKPTRVTGGSDDEYPGERGWLASFLVEVTNTGDKPLPLDAKGTDIDLIMPVSAGSAHQIGRPQIRRAYDSRGPSVGEQVPIAPDQTVTGWAEFVVPIWAPPMLRARPADLEFFRPGQPDSHFRGLIRLWK
jgi:hypothetical protein